MPGSRQRPWWSRWWAVVLWFVAACACVTPAVVGWSFTAFYTLEANQAGIDMVVDDGPSAFARVMAAIGALLALLLPFLAARWARKMWLGYLLLAFLLSVVVLAIGLMMFRVL